MNFEDVKLFYAVACVVLGLIILLPTLMAVVSFPEGERFSELWLLGPGRMAEGYPLSVSAGEPYKVYLGVGNHMGGLAYYKVCVKFRNQSEPLPNATTGEPSSIAPIYEYLVFLGDNATWEREVSFSFEDVSFDGNVSRVGALSVDGHFADVDRIAVWDDERGGFFYQLFFELWLYNATVSDFTYHNRCVWLWFNVSRLL